MSKIILVTGAAGFLGSCATAMLLKENYSVIGIDNFSTQSKNNLKKIKDSSNFSFYDVDIRDSKKLNSIFNKYNISCVMHFAAYKSVPLSFLKPLDYFNNNISGLINLLDVMNNNSVNNLIFSSSATIYGDSHIQPLKESYKTDFINPYDYTKVSCENIITQMSKYTNLKSIILRYFNPVGSDENHLIGDSVDDLATNLIPSINKFILGKVDEIRVYGNKYNTHDGTCLRDYIHVIDLINGHIQCIDYLSNNKFNFEIFNLGTGKPHSVLDVIHSFEEHLGFKLPFKICEPREGDAPVCYASIKKAKKYLNWSAKKNLSTMCKDNLIWLKNEFKV